jgi:hypothetical protein
MLRARALLDILLGVDSRPSGNDPVSAVAASPDDSSEHHADARTPAPAGPLARVIPPGFAGRGHLTIPLATLLGRADRPGEMAGIGPIDPDPGANTFGSLPNRSHR